MYNLKLTIFVFALSVLALSFTSTLGQSSTATLSGTVTDQNSAVVAGATVTIRNVATGFMRTAQTHDDGSFVFPLLPPANYRLSVERSGFNPYEASEVVLNVGDQKALQIELNVGAVNGAVDVTTEASLVNESPSVTTVVDQRFVQSVPLNGRSLQSLILLTPGVSTNTPQSASLPGYSGDLSVNGQRTEENQYSVDGVSANNGTYKYGYSTAGSGGGLPTATALGSTQSLVTIDALQEFKVSSSTYSAEYGRSPGGQFSFVSKSGAKEFHGSAFEYFRNDALDANDWFNNSLSRPRQVERQNDFGGTFGGPVILPKIYNGRERTFFFVSYEGLRLTQPLPAQLVYVPSLALRAQAAPALRPALNAYPVPSNPAVRPDGLSEYIMTDSLPSDLGATSVRIDHNINANQRLFFRFSNTPSESVARSVAYHQTTSFEPRTYSVGWTGIFGSRINNEFRFGFSQNTGRYVDRGIDLDGAVPVDLRVAQGIDPGAHPSSFVYVGLSFPAQSAGSGGADRHDQRQNQFNIHDTFDYVIGNHRFRLGGDWLETSSDLQPSDIFVAASYNSAAALIANTVTSGVLYRAGGAHAVFDNLGLFVQDEWRVSRRLNLSLGLRWEVAPPPRVTSGITPRVVTGSILQPSSLALAPEGTPFYKTTYDNFAPRFGLAYVLRESPASETVVRGGFGVYYDNGQNIRSAAFDSNPGIYAQRSFASTPALPVNFPFTQAQLDFTVNSSLTPPYGDMYVYGDPSNPFKLPVTFQWNVSVEQALGRQQSLSISYVGAHGSRLLEWDQRDFHLLNPLFTRIIVNKNGLTSDYDAMQLQFQRRLSRGLQAMASYTWSHAIDFGSTNRALPVKRGDSDYDLRHNFAAAVSYDIPSLWENRLAKAVVGGWTVNGRFSARTGFPVTIAGSTFTDPATGLQYPGGADLVPGVPLYVDDPTAPGGRRINRAAFAVPATGQAGNAPRNIVRGFGATQVDLSLRRNFSLRERLHLQLGLEAFNVLNHPNFGLINTTLGTNASPNPLFGKATKMLSSSLGGLSALYQQGGPRSLQLNIRLAF